MKAAVIIPAYNSSAFIDQTIESVRSQTVADFELIVVNDGSTDETASIVCRWAAIDRRIRLVEQKNSGVARALNRGLEEVSDDAEFVSILGHDDVWDPALLERLEGAVNADPAAVGAYAMARYVDECGEPVRIGELEQYLSDRRAVNGRGSIPCAAGEPTTFEVIVCKNYVPASAVLVRKSVLDKVGPFDPECVGAEDWDMWIRVCQHGHLIALPDVLLKYRVHGGNMTRNKAMIDAACDRVRVKHMRGQSLDPEKRQTVITAARCANRWDAKLRVGWAREAASRGRIIDALKHMRHAVRDFVASFVLA